MPTPFKVDRDAEPLQKSMVILSGFLKQEADEAPQVEYIEQDGLKDAPQDEESVHKILPDAWLETAHYKAIDQDGMSNKTCFGMVRTIRSRSRSTHHSLHIPQR